jgi:hypothetical protein
VAPWRVAGTAALQTVNYEEELLVLKSALEMHPRLEERQKERKKI